MPKLAALTLSLSLSLSLFALPDVAGAVTLVLDPLDDGTAMTTPIPEFAEYEVWRYRLVDLDLGALYGAAAPAAPDPYVTLNLFDDAVFQVEFLNLERMPDIDVDVWTGVVDGWMGPGTAVFVMDPQDGRFLGGVRVNGELFHLQYNQEEGRYYLAQLNPDFRFGDIPECLDGPEPEDEPIGFDLQAHAESVQGATDGIHEISVMVVHDEELSAGWYFGLPAAYALGEANVTLALQGNRARFKARNFLPSDYPPSGFLLNDLTWLTGSSYASNNRGSADLVLLMVGRGDGCGIAYLGDGVSHSTTAFTSVVVRHCAITNLTLPHELGHNLSACHDPYSANCEDGFASDRHGYVLSWQQYDEDCPWYKPITHCQETTGVRSIMAYDRECNVGGYACPRVPLFSDPAYDWTVPDPFIHGWTHDLPFGSPDLANNNRVIDETSAFVKDYR